MNILKLSNGSEYFLPKYSESDSQLDLTVTGCLVNEIKSLTEDDLKTVQIYTVDYIPVGEYYDMELGDSFSYSSLFDQTSFILQKHGTKDLDERVTKLETASETNQPAIDTLNSLISTTVTASDKSGYNWKITSIGSVEVLKEYVKSDDPDDDHDGSDYTKPAYYVIGSDVEKGKWYCQESDPDLIYECIKSGTPSSFTDSEYFDIVIG